MGKRQLRIFTRHLASHLADLPGREANIILQSGATLHGIILQIDMQQLTVEDMRQKKHRLPVHLIAEIILDKETSF